MTTRIEQPYMAEEWFGILCGEVAKSSRRRVGEEIGYSTTAISLVLNGKYIGKTNKVREQVLARYTQVACPHTRQTMPLHVCVETANGKAPTHNPIKMAHWRACQNCPKRRA